MDAPKDDTIGTLVVSRALNGGTLIHDAAGAAVRVRADQRPALIAALATAEEDHQAERARAARPAPEA